MKCGNKAPSSPGRIAKLIDCRSQEPSYRWACDTIDGSNHCRAFDVPRRLWERPVGLVASRRDGGRDRRSGEYNCGKPSTAKVKSSRALSIEGATRRGPSRIKTGSPAHNAKLLEVRKSGSSVRVPLPSKLIISLQIMTRVQRSSKGLGVKKRSEAPALIALNTGQPRAHANAARHDDTRTTLA